MYSPHASLKLLAVVAVAGCVPGVLAERKNDDLDEAGSKIMETSFPTKAAQTLELAEVRIDIALGETSRIPPFDSSSIQSHIQALDASNSQVKMAPTPAAVAAQATMKKLLEVVRSETTSANDKKEIAKTILLLMDTAEAGAGSDADFAKSSDDEQPAKVTYSLTGAPQYQGLFLDANNAEIWAIPKEPTRNPDHPDKEGVWMTVKTIATHQSSGKAAVVRTIHIRVRSKDEATPANGPNGRACLNGGTPIDTISFNNEFTCNCSNTTFTVGDNCEFEPLDTTGAVVGVITATLILAASIAFIRMWL